VERLGTYFVLLSVRDFRETFRMNKFELALTRRSLSRFCTAMQPSYELSRAHELMISHVQRLIEGKITRLALILPPRHGKSELANVLAPAFALGRNPREKIISITYGAELSEGFGRKVRNTLIDPAFQQIFPNCKLSPDSAAAYRFETLSGGEYSATGKGGPITGRGAGILILDDLIKDFQEGNSDTACRSVVEWLQAVALTRLQPHARILAIGTRWSQRDPLQWLISQPGFVVLHLPAISTGKHDPLNRPAGAALWPKQYSSEKLEEIRRDIGTRTFSTLYQGDVTSAEGSIFRRSWFSYYKERPAKFNKIIQSWDCAFKIGRQNDFSVCTTWGVTDSGFYLLHMWRQKVEFPILKKAVAELAAMWTPSEILIEDSASGQSLVQELRTSTTYPIIPIRPDKDKESRAHSTTGFFESGKVLFPENVSWVLDVEDELCGFPNFLHDDICDSITQSLNFLRGRGDDLTVIQVLKSFAKNMFGPKPVPVSVVPSVPARTCSRCGSANVHAHDSGGTVHCRACGNYFQNEPTWVLCTKCGAHTNVCGGAGRRCVACGFQHWPTGTAPRLPKFPTRRDMPSSGWRN
jgi:predicted phage terminase large subunit-like protein